MKHLVTVFTGKDCGPEKMINVSLWQSEDDFVFHVLRKVTGFNSKEIENQALIFEPDDEVFSSKNFFEAADFMKTV